MVSRAARPGAPMNETAWWVTVLGSLGTLIGLVLKYRTDMRAAAVAREQVRQETKDAAADNEQQLRDQLFSETRALRRELREQKAAYTDEIAAIRGEALLQQRALGLELKTVRSHVQQSRTDIHTLNTQLYQMTTYWAEVHRIAMLLYPAEYVQILAQVRVPKPEWQPRPPDQLSAPEEGDPNDD